MVAIVVNLVAVFVMDNKITNMNESEDNILNGDNKGTLIQSNPYPDWNWDENPCGEE